MKRFVTILVFCLPLYGVLAVAPPSLAQDDATPSPGSPPLAPQVVPIQEAGAQEAADAWEPSAIETQLDDLASELSNMGIYEVQPLTGEQALAVESTKGIGWEADCCSLGIRGNASYLYESPALSPNSLLNPNNRLKTAERSDQALLSLEVNAMVAPYIAWRAKGRVQHRSEWSDGQIQPEDTRYLDQGYFSFEIPRSWEAPALYFALGKQRLKWGVGTLWNPVDTFNQSQNLQANHDTEEGKVLYRLDSVWRELDLTLISIPRFDHNDLTRVNFSPKQGESFIGGKVHVFLWDADLSYYWTKKEQEGAKQGVSFSLQYHDVQYYGEGLFWHGESNLRYPELVEKRTPGVDPVSGKAYTNPARYDFQTRNGNFHEQTFGLQYTFLVDYTLVTEYHHNQEGYSKKDMDIYLQYLRYIGGKYPRDKRSVERVNSEANLESQRSLLSLGNQVHPFANLRQNYLYLSFLWKNIFNRSQVQLEWIENLDAQYDGAKQSSFARPTLTYTGIPRYEFSAYSQLYQGENDSEFGMRESDQVNFMEIKYYF